MDGLLSPWHDERRETRKQLDELERKHSQVVDLFASVRDIDQQWSSTDDSRYNENSWIASGHPDYGDGMIFVRQLHLLVILRLRQGQIHDAPPASSRDKYLPYILKLNLQKSRETSDQRGFLRAIRLSEVDHVRGLGDETLHEKGEPPASGFAMKPEATEPTRQKSAPPT